MSTKLRPASQPMTGMTAWAAPNAPATLRTRATETGFPEQLIPKDMAKQSIARPTDIITKLNIFISSSISSRQDTSDPTDQGQAFLNTAFQKC